MKTETLSPTTQTRLWIVETPELDLSINPEENEAFPMEELKNLTKPAIEKRATTYLGEYRFRLSVDDYQLAWDGNIKGLYESESLASQARRSIEQIQMRGESAHREMADLAGIESLDQQLINAQNGDIVAWFSPPEVDHPRCGEYGFGYIGRVSCGETESDKKRLDMYSYRIEDTDIGRYNQALSRLTGFNGSYSTPEQFIASPMVLSRLETDDIERVLYEVFGFSVPPQEKKLKKQTMQMIDGHMNRFVDAVYTQKPTQVQSARFNQLEWYATHVWDRLNSEYDRNIEPNYPQYYKAERLVGHYDGSKLEVVYGSCGSSGPRNLNSSLLASIENGFGFKSLFKAQFEKKDWEWKKGDCRPDKEGGCGKKNVKVGPCNICQECQAKYDAKDQN